MTFPIDPLSPLGAIDIGSNAIRMVCAGDDGKVLEKLREPVRLGADVFGEGQIGQATWKRALEAFRHFREALDRHEVHELRAVGTSALREAANREKFVKAVWEHTGIAIEVITGEEEANLIHNAVMRRLDRTREPRLLIDIGGGSVELTLVVDFRIKAVETLKIGTVRLLNEMTRHQWSPARLDEELGARLKEPLARLMSLSGGPLDCCVGTGGNCKTLGKVARRLYDRNDRSLDRATLDALVGDLMRLSPEERERTYNFQPDRSDVVLPAALVLQQILRQTGCGLLRTLKAGLVDGVLEAKLPTPADLRRSGT